MKTCKHYDEKDGSCRGYHVSGQRLGGWVERAPGTECVFKGVPPEEERNNKWCLGYEPDEKGEER